MASLALKDGSTDDAPDARRSVVGAPSSAFAVVEAAPIVIQAEAATITDVGVASGSRITRVVAPGAPDAGGNVRAGAVDGAYVDFGTDAGDALSFSVNAPTAGAYTVTFRYANGAATARPLDLSIDGGAPVRVAFAPTAAAGVNAWEAWTDVAVTITLQAGVNAVRLAIPAGFSQGPNIDQATFTLNVEPDNNPPPDIPVARLAISGLDDAAADDRLVFSSVTVPDRSASTVALGGQEFRDDATITLSNSGTASLSILELSLSGPGAAGFQIVGAPTAIAAGGSANVTIRFIGVDPASDKIAVRYDAALTVRTNAAVDATQVIDLAGLAQRRSEMGQEATAAEIVAAFGYTTDVAQAQLRNGGRVETVGDEVLAPYFQRLDGSRPVEIIQMAAFLGQDDVSRLGFHGLDSATTTFLFAQDDQQGQTVSPDGHVAGPGDTGSVARGVINSDAPFGIRIAVDGRPTFAGWSDPVANRLDPALDAVVGADRGHLIRYFVARDADGAVIPGTYIGLQDYAGGVNFDYNDHVFLIRNVRPHALSAAEDADRDGVNDALERDGDGDGTVDFFDFDIPTGGQSAFNGTGTPWQVGPSAAFSLLARQFDNGGQGVAYSDTSSRKLGDVSARPDAGVDISATSGAVAHTQAGEWLEYTLNVAAAGDYALSFEAATPNAGRSIIATFARHGAVYETAAADVVDSGSYGVFVETAAEVVTLRAGVQVLRVAFNAGGQDLRDINLVAVDLLV